MNRGNLTGLAAKAIGKGTSAEDTAADGAGSCPEDDANSKSGGKKKDSTAKPDKAKQNKGLMGGLGDQFGAAANVALGAAGNVAGRAVEAGKDVGEKAADTAWQKAGAGIEAAGNARKDMQILLQRWVTKNVFKQVVKNVDRVPAMVKDILNDPEMPRCAKSAQDQAIQMGWPDVRVEFLRILAAAAVRKPPPEVADDILPRCCLLAFLRYHFCPFDKGFWGLVKDPFNVLWNLIALIPYLGVSPALFLFIFLIIDKNDEYQLIAFILRFKGTQFISQGLIKTISGHVAFVLCVSHSSTGGLGQHSHTCYKQGPWMEGNGFIVVGCLLLQILLVWTAFLLLPYSKERGRPALHEDFDIRELDATAGSRTKGGYLFYLLIWDLIMFAICIGCLFLFLLTGPSQVLEEGMEKPELDWFTRQALFNVQLLYGYLSLPFFIFTLPVLKPILTHSYPTAYDRNGRARRPCMPERPPPPPEDEKEKQPMLDPEEVNKLMEQFKGIFQGKSLTEVDPQSIADVDPRKAAGLEAQPGSTGKVFRKEAGKWSGSVGCFGNKGPGKE